MVTIKGSQNSVFSSLKVTADPEANWIVIAFIEYASRMTYFMDRETAKRLQFALARELARLEAQK